jgi:hypothetical protein
VKYNPRVLCYTRCVHCRRIVQSTPEPPGTFALQGKPVKSAHVDHVSPYCERFQGETMYDCVEWQGDNWTEGRPN